MNNVNIERILNMNDDGLLRRKEFGKKRKIDKIIQGNKCIT
jgi:hypothetical protein